jgi:uncharacterized membrane protein YhaH (DUF805 family)
MKGNVIGFDPDTNTGAISGHDGKRYDFATADWHTHDRQPHHGDLVDFAPDGQKATQIYALEAAYVPPTFGQFLFSVQGRISRSQLWLKWFLPILVIYIVLGIILAAGAASGNAATVGVVGIIFVIFALLTLWPGIAVMVKRIHDRNKSGWLVLAIYVPSILYDILAPTVGRQNPATMILSLITFAVAIWFFIEFGCMRGTIGENKYGPAPVGHR